MFTWITGKKPTTHGRKTQKSDLDAYTKKQEFIFYIQEIGYFKAPIPYYTERAHLPSYLIKFTLSGEGSLTYNDNQQQLKAGDLFLLTAKNISVIKRSAKNHGKWIGSI